MRYSKRFSQRYGLWTMIFLIALGIAVMPACSKKSEKEMPPAGPSAVSDTTNDKAVAVQEKRQELLSQLQQLQRELIIMQGVTLKNYPELSEEQEALRNLIAAKMQSLLEPQNVDLDELQEMQKKFQDQSLSQEEKAALMVEFQEKAKLSRQARVDAMNDEDVKKAYLQYETHLKEQMIVDHPQASEKMASYDRIQAELQNLGNNAGAGAAPAPSN